MKPDNYESFDELMIMIGDEMDEVLDDVKFTMEHYKEIEYDGVDVSRRVSDMLNNKIKKLLK